MNLDYFWGQGVQKRYTSKSIFHDNSKNTGRKNHCNSSMEAYFNSLQRYKKIYEKTVVWKSLRGFEVFWGPWPQIWKFFLKNFLKLTELRIRFYRIIAGVFKSNIFGIMTKNRFWGVTVMGPQTPNTTKIQIFFIKNKIFQNTFWYTYWII